MEITDEEYAAAAARGAEIHRSGHAVAARYDREARRVVVELHTSLEVSFPSELVQELANHLGFIHTNIKHPRKVLLAKRPRKLIPWRILRQNSRLLFFSSNIHLFFRSSCNCCSRRQCRFCIPCYLFRRILRRRCCRHCIDLPFLRAAVT